MLETTVKHFPFMFLVPHLILSRQLNTWNFASIKCNFFPQLSTYHRRVPSYLAFSAHLRVFLSGAPNQAIVLSSHSYTIHNMSLNDLPRRTHCAASDSQNRLFSSFSFTKMIFFIYLPAAKTRLWFSLFSRTVFLYCSFPVVTLD